MLSKLTEAAEFPRNVAAPRALSKAGRTLRDAVKAPEMTGRLARAIRYRRNKRAEAGGATTVYDVYVKPGKSRDDQTGAYYWLFVEFGAKFSRAQPFMRPAFANQNSAAVSAFSEEFQKQFFKKFPT